MEMNNSVRNFTRELSCDAWLGSASNGFFRGDDPLKYSTPLLLLLISLVSTLASVFEALLPLANVHFVTQILAGIFLGPSVLGQNIDFVRKLFNTRSSFIIESFEAISFMFISYISTAQVDIGVIKRGGKLAIINGVSLFLLPYAVATTAGLIITTNIEGSVAKTRHNQLQDMLTNESIVYFQVAYSVLSNLKMLNSEPGRLALSSIMVANCFGWGFFLLVITFSGFLDPKVDSATSIQSTFSKVLLIGAIVTVCRPIFKWIVRSTPEGKKLRGLHLCIICVMLCITTFLSETVGYPYVVGSVALGLVTPKTAPLGTGLTDKIGCFCSMVLIPCYVIGIGNKVDIYSFCKSDVITLELLFFTINAAKFASIVLPSLYFKVPVSHAAIAGFIVCIQGIYDVQIFKQLLNYKNISKESFGIMVISAMFHSTIYTTIVKNLYGWVQRKHITYRRQTVQHYEPNNPLKILTCFYHCETVPSILTILELCSCPSSVSLLSVTSINLEELEHHDVPLLIKHDCDSSMSSNKRYRISKAFKNFENVHVLQNNVSVECYTAVAPRTTMHEDVCTLAFDKETDLIIVGVDPNEGIAAERRLCGNVQNNSPCSVAVLLDQGRLPDFKNMGVAKKNGSMKINICSIFLGGADDRETLAFAVRMTNHPCVNLNVLKLIDSSDNVSQLNDIIERRLDARALQKYQEDTFNKSVSLREVKIKEASDIVDLLRAEGNNYDLIMVGVRHEASFEVLQGLSEWSENEEFGEIGDLLISRDLKLRASVLAVQQQLSSVVEEGSVV